MNAPSVAIVGVGAVGRSMRTLFPDAVLYDEPLGLGSREAVSRCDFAFVCVPTPSTATGACDTSIVEDVVSWCDSDTVVLRSTVAPGTTDRLASTYRRRVIFQPAYGPGSTPDHPYADARSLGWIILGGPREWTVPVADLYKRVLSADLVIQQTEATTAELTKYMENAFLAAKVAFCNEFYDLAAALGVDYNELRELWLLDSRIGRSHTWVHPEDRGFGGDCLPKDLAALLRAAEDADVSAHLLHAVAESNQRVRQEQAGADIQTILNR
jgi:UDPglucose 6-dehydrogenase